jgi:hypothetical protein
LGSRKPHASAIMRYLWSFCTPVEFLTLFLRVITSYQSVIVKSAEKILCSKFSSIDEILRFFSVVPKTIDYTFCREILVTNLFPDGPLLSLIFPYYLTGLEPSTQPDQGQVCRRGYCWQVVNQKVIVWVWESASGCYERFDIKI